MIASGTPAGIGAVRQPFPEGLLKVGDEVRIEIEGIGELRNAVVEEPDGYLAPRPSKRQRGRTDQESCATSSTRPRRGCSLRPPQ